MPPKGSRKYSDGIAIPEGAATAAVPYDNDMDLLLSELHGQVDKDRDGRRDGILLLDDDLEEGDDVDGVNDDGFFAPGQARVTGNKILTAHYECPPPRLGCSSNVGEVVNYLNAIANSDPRASFGLLHKGALLAIESSEASLGSGWSARPSGTDDYPIPPVRLAVSPFMATGRKRSAAVCFEVEGLSARVAARPAVEREERLIDELLGHRRYLLRRSELLSRAQHAALQQHARTVAKGHRNRLPGQQKQQPQQQQEQLKKELASEATPEQNTE